MSFVIMIAFVLAISFRLSIMCDSVVSLNTFDFQSVLVDDFAFSKNKNNQISLNVILKNFTRNQTSFLAAYNLTMVKINMRKFANRNSSLIFSIPLQQKQTPGKNKNDTISYFYNSFKYLKGISLNLHMESCYILCMSFMNANETLSFHYSESMCIDLSFDLYGNGSGYCTFHNTTTFEHVLYYKPMFIPIMYFLCTCIFIPVSFISSNTVDNSYWLFFPVPVANIPNPNSGMVLFKVHD